MISGTAETLDIYLVLGLLDRCCDVVGYKNAKPSSNCCSYETSPGQLRKLASRVRKSR